MADFRDNYLADMKGCTVLDVGAARVQGQRLCYRRLFREYEYTGMDIVAGDNVDVVGYEDLAECYDVVISGQVMEHIKYPWQWLEGLSGLFRHYICIIAPNTFPEHRCPVDCYRFYPDGMAALFEWAGIVPVDISMAGVDTRGIGTQ